MRIVFEPSTLRQGKTGSVIGGVHFDFGGNRQFPDEAWSDFVVVIASWWFSALKLIVEEQLQADFRFMDGPSWITATLEGPALKLQCIDNRGHVEIVCEAATVADFERELMTYARAVSLSCSTAGIQSPDLIELRRHFGH